MLLLQSRHHCAPFCVDLFLISDRLTVVRSRRAMAVLTPPMCQWQKVKVKWISSRHGAQRVLVRY
jgi:hypothetical protein